VQPDDDLGHVNHDDMKDLSTFVIGQDRIEGADLPQLTVARFQLAILRQSRDRPSAFHDAHGRWTQRTEGRTGIPAEDGPKECQSVGTRAVEDLCGGRNG
jgi:hypothetical protein